MFGVRVLDALNTFPRLRPGTLTPVKPAPSIAHCGTPAGRSTPVPGSASRRLREVARRVPILQEAAPFDTFTTCIYFRLVFSAVHGVVFKISFYLDSCAGINVMCKLGIHAASKLQAGLGIPSDAHHRFDGIVSERRQKLGDFLGFAVRRSRYAPARFVPESHLIASTLDRVHSQWRAGPRAFHRKG